MSEVKNDAFERKMARMNNSIVHIKNISDKDFQHSYDGFSYILKAGETLPFQYPIGMHMAKHLAMKLVRKAFIEKAKDPRMKQTTNLYTDVALKPYMDKIVVSREDKPAEPKRSESEIMNEKTEAMQRQFREETSQKVANVTKNDVMSELKKRNVTFDARQTKDELLALLTQAEMDGNTGEEE